MKTCDKCGQKVRLVRANGPTELVNLGEQSDGIGSLTGTGCHLYPVKPADDNLCWFHARERKYHGWAEEIEKRRIKALSKTRKLVR